MGRASTTRSAFAFASTVRQLGSETEAVASASSIKGTLQAEVAGLTASLKAEQSARGAAERRAEAAGYEVVRLQGETGAAASALAQEKRAAERAKEAAAEEHASLLDRLMKTQAELASVRGGTGGGGGTLLLRGELESRVHPVDGVKRLALRLLRVVRLALQGVLWCCFVDLWFCLVTRQCDFSFCFLTFCTISRLFASNV